MAGGEVHDGGKAWEGVLPDSTPWPFWMEFPLRRHRIITYPKSKIMFSRSLTATSFFFG